MARRLRFIPPEGALVEITCRTLHGRHLLRPSRRLNQLLLGVLGRAKRRYPVGLHAFVFMSNHYHLLVSAPNAQRLAQFMSFLNGNLAREAGRLHRWREKVWSRRYQAIVVSDEPAAQIARLKYVLSHGAKEGLVRHPARWRGAHCVRPLVDGSIVEGIWVDRTSLYCARLRGEKVTEKDCSTVESFSLEPLPCWKDLEPATQRKKILDLLEQIIEEAEKRTHDEKSTRGATPAGYPHHRPHRLKRSPAPWFHCSSRTARRQLTKAYHLFAAAYRDAADALKRGDPRLDFPEGSFPPALPYVSAS